MLRCNGGLGAEQFGLQRWWTGQEGSIRSNRDTDKGGLDRQGLLLTQAGEWELLRHLLVLQTLKPTPFSTSFCVYEATCRIRFFKLENLQ